MVWDLPLLHNLKKGGTWHMGITFEERVWELMRAGIAVELLIPSVRETGATVGIRLRTWGKQLPKNMMVLGTALTFADALEDAVEKASNRRWEHLDWSKRPWEIAGAGDRETATVYGLL